MGEVRVQKKPNSATIEAVTVGEFGTDYLRINLDYCDKSVTIESSRDEKQGWFWLDAPDGAQTIDEVIEALELAKQRLTEGQD